MDEENVQNTGGAGAGAGGAGAGGGAGASGGSLITKVETPPAGGSGAGAGGETWHATLPEEYRAHPALKDYKDISGLVKSHINLQTMVGADKVVIPNDKSAPEVVAEFRKRMGVPEKADGYKLPEMKFTNGATIPEETLNHFKGVFHKIGLSQKQTADLMTEFATHEGNSITKRAETVQASQKQALESLKTEYGEAYQEKINAAQIAVKTFGNDEMFKWLDATGLGNDANFIKFFANIGSALLEDKAVGGGGLKFTQTPAQAEGEIAALKKDKDFLIALSNKSAPGHKEALEKWTDLHSKLTPKSQVSMD